MDSAEIREKFLKFFESRGHAIVPSSSLVPENDPTTLFTGSGMQPLIPYLLGQPYPKGKRIVNSQKCFRAEDIDEVGDNRHTTFFEMLGNWSFGDYWKEDQIKWIFEFLTDIVGLNPQKLYVTVFAGDKEVGIPADEESIEIWKKLFKGKSIEANYKELGSEKEGSEKGMQDGRIFSYDVKKNWWSRAGIPSKMPAGEPGGPDSEMFYDFGTPHDTKFGKECHPNCNCGRFLEIGNSVFMEYKKKEDGTFEKLVQRNVDFGGGLERIVAASKGDPDIFKIDIFMGAIQLIEEFSEKLYQDQLNTKIFRIIIDHIRAATFMIADGIIPSNTGQGYVLRRLIRRSVRYADSLGLKQGAQGTNILSHLSQIVDWYVSKYMDVYPDLVARAGTIYEKLEKEEERFRTTLKEGLHEFEKIVEGKNDLKFHSGESIPALTGEEAFDLYQNHGFPLELTIEELERASLPFDELGLRAQFGRCLDHHENLSRTASAGQFAGGLADHSEKTIKLHTAHHLLVKALQIVLGPQVKQRGSNITSERLRMDFVYDTKMTDEQKKEAARIVNEKIAEDLPVTRTEMALVEAEGLGAEHEFGQKYPDRVSVYSVGPKSATQENPQIDQAFSLEFCGGPHVSHTGEIGEFKIVKEEAVSAGVRRIRAIIE